MTLILISIFYSNSLYGELSIKKKWYQNFFQSFFSKEESPEIKNTNLLVDHIKQTRTKHLLKEIETQLDEASQNYHSEAKIHLLLKTAKTEKN